MEDTGAAAGNEMNEFMPANTPYGYPLPIILL
jgi:hypothetical protein